MRDCEPMSPKRQRISAAVEKILRGARVARLATVDAKSRPHIVPVCFAYDGMFFYSAIDEKPKRVPRERLARLQNIRATPRVALLIDEYDKLGIDEKKIVGEVQSGTFSARRRTAAGLRCAPDVENDSRPGFFELGGRA